MTLSILVVANNERSSKLIKNTLEKAGHEVETEVSGIEALQRSKNCTFSLIIVGEQLADVDGVEWLSKFRESDKGTKVAFISNSWGNASLYAVLRKELNVALVLHRPLRTSLLGAQIEALFNDSVNFQDSPTTPHSEVSVLDTVRRRFRKTLPVRLGALTKLLRGCSSSENLDLLSDAQRLAHSMKGTAGSLGFIELSEIMCSLDDLCSTMMEDISLLDSEESWRSVEKLTDLAAAVCKTLNEQSVSDLNDTEDLCTDAARIQVLYVSKESPPTVTDADCRDSLPMQIIHVRDAKEALSKASLVMLDAALIDEVGDSLRMTFELARNVRSLTGHENLPLAFIHQLGEGPDDTIGATHAGSSLFLNKPVNAASLVSTVEHLIHLRQGGRPRILVVDDDMTFGEIIINILGSEGMLVRLLQDPSDIFNTMRSFSPDLVLLDILMPSISGFDVCRMLRSVDIYKDLPILFLTAKTEVDARVEAFECGGDDYLPKPIVPIELLARVKTRLERSRLLKDRMQNDVLTGLLLRRPFMEQMNALLSESKRHQLNFSLGLIDVDHFKIVNDTYGHLIGDNVLTILGQLLKRRFRVEDIRGRWGGEEFIIAFRNESKNTMMGALLRALDEFKAMTFESDDNVKFHISFSAGVGEFPSDGDSIPKLLRCVDRRLYRAKDQGRSTIVMDQ